MRPAAILLLVLAGCAARAPGARSKQARPIEIPAAITRCDEASECAVRAAGCCECGARSWTAVRRDQLEAYASLVCGRSTACPECVGRPPAHLRAACVAHRCVTSSAQ